MSASSGPSARDRKLLFTEDSSDIVALSDFYLPLDRRKCLPMMRNGNGDIPWRKLAKTRTRMSKPKTETI